MKESNVRDISQATMMAVERPMAGVTVQIVGAGGSDAVVLEPIEIQSNQKFPPVPTSGSIRT